MSTEAKHVHDCTGPDSTCPCGYRFTVPRFGFSLKIWDNNTPGREKGVINESFMSDDPEGMIRALEGVLHNLRGINEIFRFGRG